MPWAGAAPVPSMERDAGEGEGRALIGHEGVRQGAGGLVGGRLGGADEHET